MDELDRVNAPQGAEHFIFFPVHDAAYPKDAFAITLHRVDGQWYVNLWERRYGVDWVKLLDEYALQSEEPSVIAYRGVFMGITYSDTLMSRLQTDDRFDMAVKVMKTLAWSGLTLAEIDDNNLANGWTLD